MKKSLALSLSDIVFIMLINVNMPTVVGILTLMSRINFVLSWVEHEKSFITSGQDYVIVTYRSKHAPIFSDGPTATEESYDHNNNTHDNKDVSTGIQEVEVLTVVDILAEVFIHSHPYTHTKDRTA